MAFPAASTHSRPSLRGLASGDVSFLKIPAGPKRPSRTATSRWGTALRDAQQRDPEGLISRAKGWQSRETHCPGPNPELLPARSPIFNVLLPLEARGCASNAWAMRRRPAHVRRQVQPLLWRGRFVLSARMEIPKKSHFSLASRRIVRWSGRWKPGFHAPGQPRPGWRLQNLLALMNR